MNDVLPLLIALIVSIFITYPISSKLAKSNVYYVLILPVLFLMSSGILWILGLIANDWSALGYLLLAVVASIVFFGSVITSLYIYLRFRKTKSNS